MTDRPFEYDPSLLSSCAESDLAAYVVAAAAPDASGPPPFGGEGGAGAAACVELFRLHARHYGRPHAADADLLPPLAPSSSSPSRQAAAERAPPAADGAAGGPRAAVDRVLPPRLERFVRSAAFVHRHNAAAAGAGGGGARRHEVALNRFSDLRERELPLMRAEGLGLGDGGGEALSTPFLPSYEEALDWDEAWDDGDGGDGDEDEGDAAPGLEDGEMEADPPPLYLRLDAETMSQRVLPGIGVGRNRIRNSKLGKKKKKKKDGKRKKKSEKREHKKEKRKRHVLPPPPGEDSMFRDYGPVVIKSRKDFLPRHGRKGRGRSGGAVLAAEDGYGGLGAAAADRYDPDDEDDEFRTDLNWATGQNPDGVGVVHEPMDQGSCGSCWAIAATGTVEANVARHAAFDAFSGYVKENVRGARDVGDVSGRDRRRATAVARDAEGAALAEALLSVQELVDCDVEFDQGCTGGNPLLAFYFIHRYGLASAERYPYIGRQEDCHVKRVMHPVATVQSWGVLTPNHEDNMELVLRYIGPIAVGVNGADPAFLAYRGGVFDSPECGQDANHALLVVGYGEELVPPGDVDDEGGRRSSVRYWIARNSWGAGWGEGGYVRIRRGSGKRGREGVCGIARSPSVALGSALLVPTDPASVAGSGIDGGGGAASGMRRSAARGMQKTGQVIAADSVYARENDAIGISFMIERNFAGIIVAGVLSLLVLLAFVFMRAGRRIRREETRSEQHQVAGERSFHNPRQEGSLIEDESIGLLENAAPKLYGSS